MRSISTLVLMLMGFSLGVPSHAHKGFFMSDKSPDEPPDIPPEKPDKPPDT